MHFEQVLVDDQAAVTMVVDDLDVDFSAQTEYLTFCTSSYPKLRPANPESNWGEVFSPVNTMLPILFNKAEQTVIAQTFVTIHANLAEYAKHPNPVVSVLEIVQQQGELIKQLDGKINLLRRLVKYVDDGNIRLTDFSKAGDRAQDTPELTFKREHVVPVTGCILFSKLLCPLYAICLQYFDSLPEFTTDTKTVVVSNLALPAIMAHYQPLMEKLFHYIKHFVHRQYSTTDTKSAMVGITTASATNVKFGELVVRLWVNVNLGANENNPMGFIATSVQRSLSNKTVRYQYHTRLYERFEDDDANTGVLEKDSAPSQRPLWALHIPQTLAPNIVRHALTEMGISMPEFEQCNAFYTRSPYNISFTTHTLVSTMFGREFGGGEAIGYLQFDQFKELVTTAQLLAFSLGFPWLGHLLTSKVAIHPSSENTRGEYQLRTQYASSAEYRTVAARYTTVGPHVWHNVITEMVIEIVAKKHYYNTAPIIWEAKSQEIKNGTEITVTEALGREISAFVCHIHNKG